MIKFKRGTRISDFTNNYVMLILQVVNDTAPADYTPTITSGNDGKHRQGSKHYDDRAFDVRVYDYPEFDNSKEMRKVSQKPIEEWIRLMKQWFNPEIYKIVYGVHKHYDHIHIEYTGE